MNWPKVKRIETEDEFKAVKAASEGNGHGLYLPTHMVTKGDLVVGWASLEAIPASFYWFHTQHLTPRDCFELTNFYENWHRERKHAFALPIVSAKSEFVQALTGMGYVPLEAIPMIKDLRG